MHVIKHYCYMLVTCHVLANMHANEGNMHVTCNTFPARSSAFNSIGHH